MIWGQSSTSSNAGAQLDRRGGGLSGGRGIEEQLSQEGWDDFRGHELQPPTGEFPNSCHFSPLPLSWHLLIIECREYLQVTLMILPWYVADIALYRKGLHQDL